ncbi:hypothetical protein Plano_0078 [Planococcus sp. PAMC 21323]|uniref:hypothetical protein n=1 Tax=Planococcus sp. PAMC 21323 TaxID=1526927 RepID=UPI00056EB5CC|nr:hypothetical protein [Planococcus sp. PAMC 21323]AIY04043.1 hypothetical protein Plano_0078 [Planococcus sp. PAMC 21323]
MRSNYPNLHGHKDNWKYKEVSNVGLFFQDFKDHLNKTNIEEAKKVLEKCLIEFYFDPITLNFENIKLIIENVDNAATTLNELTVIEEEYLKN